MCTVRFSYKTPGKCSLRRRRKLTSVINVCNAAPRSLFWVLNGLNEVPEVRFEFPFIVIGKSTMAFLTGQSWRVLKPWYTCGAQNKDFGAISQTGLTRSLVPCVAQATKMMKETFVNYLLTSLFHSPWLFMSCWN